MKRHAQTFNPGALVTRTQPAYPGRLRVAMSTTECSQRRGRNGSQSRVPRSLAGTRIRANEDIDVRSAHGKIDDPVETRRKNTSVMMLRLLLFAAITHCLSVGSAIGGIAFTGTVTRLDDPLGIFADAEVGNAVSGFFIYSTEVGDWAFVGTSDEYRNYQTTDPDLSKWDLLVTVETDTTEVSNKDTIEPRHLFGVQLTDNPATGASLDSIAISANHGNIFEDVPLVTEVTLNFSGDDLFDGASPPAQINFENADQRIGQFAFLADTNGDGSRESRSFVEFRVDSLSAPPVPELDSLATFGVGFLSFALACTWRRRKLNHQSG
jgi:hypothetical protein